MSFKDKYVINPEFGSLFDFESKKDELKHNAKMLMFRFITAIENNNENHEELSNKVLAAALSSSRSYVTQLFKGDKIINLIALARLQKEFNVEFEITAVPINKTTVSVNANSSSSIPTQWYFDNNQTKSFDVVFGGQHQPVTKKLA